MDQTLDQTVGAVGDAAREAGRGGAETLSDARKPSRTRAATSKRGAGLTIPRYFTRKDESPYDTVEWELRDASISNERGEVIFEQRGVEVPRSWSQLATNVMVSKYFRGHLDTPERERSVKQLVGRVVGRICEWGDKSGYFASEADRDSYSDELTYLLLHQKMAFNSPVWFNLGVKDTPQQASACFINSVEDTMESIMDLAKTEAMLFKGGSGTGFEPVPDPLVQREPGSRRWHCVGTGLLHEGLRRLRRRGEVRWQDASRRQDGHPERRPPRHPRVHPLRRPTRRRRHGR